MNLSWQWGGGVNHAAFSSSDWARSLLSNVGIQGIETGGWLGLGAIGVVAGLVAGIAEALGKQPDS